MTTLLKPLGGLLPGAVVENILGADAVASTWTPLSVAALQVWGRADSASSSPVTALVDRSAYGHNFTMAAAGPAWSATGASGGQADLVFTSGSTQGLTTTSFSPGIGTGDISMAAVLRCTDVTRGSNYFALFGGFETGLSASQFVGYLGSAGTKSFATAPVSGTWYSILMQRVSGVVELWINGVKDVNTFTSSWSIGSSSFAAGYDGGNYFGGDLPEFWMASQSLEPADITGWFAYTHARYGI
ncbi:MAG TPA: LamG-like jellyroll fold domain-containing protein [Armatimonadota bacterium]|nr:LamG-like jellyroll fold domain-containing protein [Armatimonadota bacterium]